MNRHTPVSPSGSDLRVRREDGIRATWDETALDTHGVHGFSLGRAESLEWSSQGGRPGFARGFRRIPSIAALLVLGMSWFSPLTSLGQATAPNGALDLPPGMEDYDNEEMEIRTQGPLHEAFATPSTLDPTDPIVIDREPPPLIDEIPPDYRPDGNDVVWLPGYWHFDEDLDDFLWVSGLWRQAPPGRQWEPGYWAEVEEGYQWVPGVWLREEVAAEPQYLAPPPESQEYGPSSPAPSEDHFWIPGNWVYQNRDYVWRTGYWSPAQVGWVWVPPRYVWTVSGVIYVDGYWDYPFDRRGQIFAPVYFRQPIFRHVGFRYRPWVVMDTGRLLSLHLWVNHRRGFYAFGNYYDPRFAGIGFVPWVQFGARPRFYDPYFQYARWHYGPTFITNLNTWHGYYGRHAHLRPRATFREQVLFAQSTTNVTVVNHSVFATSIHDAVGRRGTANHLSVRNTNFVRLSDDERTRISRRNESFAQQRDNRQTRDMRGREELYRETGGPPGRGGRGGPRGDALASDTDTPRRDGSGERGRGGRGESGERGERQTERGEKRQVEGKDPSKRQTETKIEEREK